MADYEGAEEDLDLAIKNGARLPVLLRMRALCSHRLGRHRDALADLDAVLEIEPNYGPAHFLRALVHETLGERVECLLNLDSALDLGYEPSRVHRSRCRVEAHTGRVKHAKTALEQAQEAGPGEIGNLDCSGDVWFAAGELEKSIADREAALSAEDSPRRRLAAAITYAFADQLPKSMEHCRVTKSSYTVANLDWGLNEIKAWEKLLADRLDTGGKRNSVVRLRQRLLELQNPRRAKRRWEKRRNHSLWSQGERMRRRESGDRW